MTSTMTSAIQTDKREYRRLDKKFVLKVAPEGETHTVSHQWTLVTSKNISAGGVLFTYDRRLREGTLLTFRIHFPKRTIDCAGVVRRSSPSAIQPLVNIAARLDGLSGDDREFIEQYSV